MNSLSINQSVDILGIMSGTSMDGLDLTIVHYDGGGYKVNDFISVSFPPKLRQSILSVADGATVTLDQWIEAEYFFTQFVAEKVNEFINGKEIAAVGFSGQTMRHNARGTLQFGSPGALAGLLGISVVGDFRSQDIGAGGQGAPLISFVDEFLFGKGEPTILLNIGGIANISFVSALHTTISFDTGPGNMLIDALARKLFGQNYDKDGKYAAQGKVCVTTLNTLLENDYFAASPPKSTGRIDFGSIYLGQFLEKTSSLDNVDKMATATALTCRTIVDAIEHHVPCNSGKIIINGGGKHNLVIMQHLREKLLHWKFEELTKYGVHEDAKESFAFAILAHRALMGKVNQIPQATGAQRELILGAIYHG